MKSLFDLPRAVWLLGLVSFCNDAASELVYPLVPLYLASVLLAGPRALGLIEGIAEATGSLLKLFAGVLADRTRSTKPWVVGGYGLAALTRPLLAFANSWPSVLTLRFADRVGKGLRTSPRDALLALSIDERRRGLAFGLHRTMDNLGAVVGPLLAAGLLAAQVPLREVFLWAALGGVAAVALALAVREPARETAPVVVPFSWTLRGLPGPFRRYLVVLGLFTLGNSSNMFLLLRARELGFPEYQVPLLWALVALTAAVFSTPLSALSDRLGRPRLIVGGWLIYAGFYLLLGFNGHPALLWPLFGLYGLFMAATEGAEKALVADLAPRALLGTAYGWFNMIAGIMLLPA
ncbi:MAG: MFS transporter, partial [Candidatus Competibacteraceae bacterium]